MRKFIELKLNKKYVDEDFFKKLDLVESFAVQIEKRVGDEVFVESDGNNFEFNCHESFMNDAVYEAKNVLATNKFQNLEKMFDVEFVNSNEETDEFSL